MSDAAVRRRSLLLTAPRRLRWTAEELPPLWDDEVLVRTAAGAISIGSELPLYRGTARSGGPATYPRMTGYESVGRVVARGGAAGRLRVGERVVAPYGHRTHGVVPEAKAIVVPDGISDALALLAILSCDVAKGVRKLDPRPDEPILVSGAGAIGLLTVFVLHASGLRAIDVIEPRAERRDLALRLGARAALPPEEGGDDEPTYAAAFECSSSAAGFALLQGRMATGGRICVLADGNREPLALAPAFHERELLVVGSSDGWDYQAHARWYFDVLHRGDRGDHDYARNLAALFDCHTTARDLAATFERLATGAIAPVKVLVRYDDADALR